MISIKSKTKFIALIITLLTAALVCIGQGERNSAVSFEMSAVLVTIFGIFPEKKEEKPPFKGTIQYDKENFDIPAMRIVFTENPLNCINCDEVTFKIDRNADLKGEMD